MTGLHALCSVRWPGSGESKGGAELDLEAVDVAQAALWLCGPNAMYAWPPTMTTRMKSGRKPARGRAGTCWGIGLAEDDHSVRLRPPACLEWEAPRPHDAVVRAASVQHRRPVFTTIEYRLEVRFAVGKKNSVMVAN